MKAVFLHDAEEDLKELRRCIVPKSGKAAWLEAKRQIEAAAGSLVTLSPDGSIPDELAELGMTQYRQAVFGMNRLIYEARGDWLCIHIVFDVRRDLRDLLARRLLRTGQ